jgi:transcriptional regulator with GAF, ATPase, and Fis domain
VSRYDLRDISNRLGRSADAEAVASEFLAALQSSHPDWRATLAFYEVSRDALVRLYERDKDQLRSREIKVSVDQLPPRMIRTFFHPHSQWEYQARPASGAAVTSGPTMFQPEMGDVALMRVLLPVATWSSCVCLPLSDRDEMLAILILVSGKKNAFTDRTIEEIMPLKSMVALALATRLHRAMRDAEPLDTMAGQRAAAEFRERIEQLSIHARELEEDNESKAGRLRTLSNQVEHLDQDSTEYRDELDRVKQALTVMEAQTSKATESLGEASAQLELAHQHLTELRSTQDFMRQVFETLANEHDPRQFTKTMVQWLSEHFHVERCSVMLVDRTGHVLRIAEQVGIPQDVAERVRVRVGQGVAGWVAANRKPLFVRERADAPEIDRNTAETYNTDSFLCVPIAYCGRLAGVLNISNKSGGVPFTDADLDRSMLVAGVFAITLGANEVVRRALAWAA